ncbi:hypothetical protein GZ77_21565 [Endozoicomonas montiporae]|uniref:Autotransporter domain-containing protein n=2 Tax=Endozoicomonas montiporae TaxID=1027273 RepID=A0A081N3I6_9GAMM|nr:autotransporter outer membrane beta-barrel domain-containing protein [Endozoicomonas montiporae]AMO58316.1 hypothetical protein EZMO1_4400 [Endozoicomonas montiporae CL-33]KEQ13009.1 hypothetical protein GZ77_21565 [Endozoicomonas montiporae]
MKTRINIQWLTAVLVVALLHGCGSGGGGGGSRSSGTGVKVTPKGVSIERTESHKHSRNEHEGRYKGLIPSSITDESFQSRVPFNSGKLDSVRQNNLKSAYDQAIRDYKAYAKQDSPRLHDLVVARYYSLKNHQQPPKGLKVTLDDSSYDTMLKAVEDVAAECRAGKVGKQIDPNFIRGQGYLTRTADEFWRNHTKSVTQIRRMNELLKEGVELGDDAPMVADINNSQGLFTGLENNHWYVYGQAYVFRGHWEPEAGLKQKYKGEGAEFGAFRFMDNGFLLGGMLGLQKVRMEADFGGSGSMDSDARIYRVGPFASWSNDRLTIDSMLTYGWVSLDTQRRDLLSNRWKASPKGSEWAAHLQASYRIPLDHWAMGLSLIPEAYAGYRLGTIEKHTEKSDDLRHSVTESKHKGLTTRLGTGVGYVFPDLSQPTDVMFKLGVQKTHGWEKREKSSSSMWAKTPKAESRDTALYYSLGVNRQFGADLDKMIGLEYTGTSGKKSGSDALIFSYRQAF